MHVYMYTYIHVYMYTCTYAYMYTCIHVSSCSTNLIVLYEFCLPMAMGKAFGVLKCRFGLAFLLPHGYGQGFSGVFGYPWLWVKRLGYHNVVLDGRLGCRGRCRGARIFSCALLGG